MLKRMPGNDSSLKVLNVRPGNAEGAYLCQRTCHMRISASKDSFYIDG